MNNKRIVFFIGTLMYGGAERVVSTLANALAEKYSSITILLYFDKEICYEIKTKVDVVIVEKETKSLNLLKNVLWIRKFISINADVVFSFLSVFNMLMIVATLGFEIPVIVSNRSDPSNEPKNIFLRILRNKLYFFADVIIVQTSSSKKYFSRLFENKTVVIPNPVSPDLMKGAGLVTTKEKTVVTVGRLIDTKNHSLLIDAFSEIANDYIDYKLVIYGDGILRHKLEKQISQLCLNNQIHLAGLTGNIFEKIKSAEIFVLTSNYEGMPNALIEAMCMGLPVISTKVSGAIDYIDSGVNGYLINCDDKYALVNALSKLINNPTDRYRCSNEAIKICDELNEEAIINKWIKLIGGI